MSIVVRRRGVAAGRDDDPLRISTRRTISRIRPSSATCTISAGSCRCTRPPEPARAMEIAAQIDLPPITADLRLLRSLPDVVAVVDVREAA